MPVQPQHTRSGGAKDLVLVVHLQVGRVVL